MLAVRSVPSRSIIGPRRGRRQPYQRPRKPTSVLVVFASQPVPQLAIAGNRAVGLAPGAYRLLVQEDGETVRKLSFDVGNAELAIDVTL